MIMLPPRSMLLLLSATVLLLSSTSTTMAFTVVSPSSIRRNTGSCNAVVSQGNQRTPLVPASGRSVTPSSLFLFGGLFESKDKAPKDGDLATYSDLPSQKFDQLSEYIRLWADLFVDEKTKGGMGLTTPVKIFPSAVEAEEGVTASNGLRIVFQKTKTGASYSSTKEEKAAQGDDDGKKKKQKKPKLEGGVEVLVEQLVTGAMIVRARRSDFDEDTLIKEMSEGKIVDELKKAMKVWTRDNKK